jgi:hypothetical protein
MLRLGLFELLVAAWKHDHGEVSRRVQEPAQMLGARQ